MSDVVAVLGARLGRAGMNLIGATSVAAYDACVAPARRLATRAPDARGIVVVGDGGGALWAVARARVLRDPDPDPLDRHTRAVVEAATRDLDGARVAFPFDPPDTAPDFRRLASLAGLGRPGLVGVLLHPEFGPWIALRAAVLVPDEVRAPRPADGFDPCPGCAERPCVAACPAGAVGPDGWRPATCAAHRLADEWHCADGCQARLDCVIGRAHRHPPDARAFHQAAARRAMAAYASAPRRA